ncbi:MAG: NRDE family protein [Saprospiraceae bacterium]|nr:NRDE family protein [Saprospiraceae bacterium]
MCTVSYMPTKSGFILTSSRDESKVRKALPPATYHLHGQDLVFPKDILAGGTWIAASERGQVACLLNGAFDKLNLKIRTSSVAARYYWIILIIKMQVLS